MRMPDVEVRVKPESFTTAYPSSVTKNATGVVYFSSGDLTFPDDAWDDFAVIVVGWWLSALADYVQCFRDTVDLLFMDGDFLVRLSGKRGLQTTVEMIEETREGDQVRFSTTADLLTLYKSVDEAAAILIDFCRSQPEEVPDCPELVAAKQRASSVFRDQLA